MSEVGAQAHLNPSLLVGDSGTFSRRVVSSVPPNIHLSLWVALLLHVFPSFTDFCFSFVFIHRHHCLLSCVSSVFHHYDEDDDDDQACNFNVVCMDGGMEEGCLSELIVLASLAMCGDETVLCLCYIGGRSCSLWLTGTE